MTLANTRAVKGLRFLTSLLAVCSLTAATAHAGTKTFDGDTNGDWNTGTNWDADTLPADTDDVVFDTNSPATVLTFLSGSTATTNSITISDQAIDFVMTGTNTLNVNAGGITLTTGHTQDFNNTTGTLNILADQSWQANNAAARLNMNWLVDLDGNTLSLNDGIGSSGTIDLITTDGIHGTGTINFNGSAALPSGSLGVVEIDGDQSNFTGNSVLYGGTLRLGNGGSLGSGSLTIEGGTITPTNAIGLANDVLVNDDFATAGANSLGLSGTVTLGTDVTITNAAGLNISGQITGAQKLTKAGTGLLILGNAANDYSDGFEFSAGTVEAADAAAFGSGTVTLGGGTLQGSSALTLANALSITGTNTLAGSNDLTFSGAAELLASSTINVDAARTSTFSGEISDGGSGFVLNKAGGGTLVINNANSGGSAYSGGTNIAGGVIQLGSAGNLPSGGALTLAIGAALDLNDRSQTIGTLNGAGGAISLGTTSASNVLTVSGGGTFGGAIIEEGALDKTGANTLTLAAASSFTGSTTISAGVLEIEDDGALGGSTVSVVDGATLRVDYGSGTFVNDVTLAGTGDAASGALSIAQGTHTLEGTITLGADASISIAAAATATFDGQITGANTLTKIGSGTMVLTDATNDFDTLDVDAGVIEVTAANALGTNLDIGGSATVDINDNNQTLGMLTGSGTLVTGTNAATDLTVGSGNASSTFAGVIEGAGELIKTGSGTLTLSGANAHTGGTNLTDGTVSVSADNNLGAGNLTLNGGALEVTGTTYNTSAKVFNLDGESTLLIDNAANTFALTSAMSGASTLHIGGSGTLQNDTGAADFIATGSVVDVIAGAALDLNNQDQTLGNLEGGGTINIGSATLTVGSANVAANFAGVFIGSGTFAKAGNETLDISADNSASFTGTYDAGAGTLRLVTAAALADSSDIVTSGGTFDLNDIDQTVDTLTGGSGTIDLGSATLTVGNGDSDFTYSGNIAASAGTLVKEGTGTFTLSAATAAHTGGTRVTGGTLSIADESVLGSGTFELNAAALYLTGATDLSALQTDITGATTVGGTNVATFGDVAMLGNSTIFFDNAGTNTISAISGAFDFVKDGNATLALTGASTLTGDLTIERGVLNVNTGATITDGTNLNLSQFGTMELNTGTYTFGALAGEGTLDLGTATLVMGSGNTTGSYTGRTLATAGVLRKIGTGTFTLSNASSAHTGGTILEDGTLILGTDEAIGTGTLTLSGGELQATTARDLSANTLALTGSTTIGGTADITFGATELTGTNTLTTANSGVTTLGVITGATGLAKDGAATLALFSDSAATYSGATTINAGTVVGGDDGAFGSGTVSLEGGTTLIADGARAFGNALILDATNTLSGTMTFGATELAGNSTVQNGATDTLTLGAVSGSAGLTKTGTGTLTLAAAGTFDGGTTLGAGTLVIGDDAALGTGTFFYQDGVVIADGDRSTTNTLSVGGTMTIGGSSSLGFGAVELTGNSTLQAENSGVTTFGAVGGAFGLTLDGGSTLVLDGASSYSGGTTLANGTLVLSNDDALGTGTLFFNAGTVLSDATHTLANNVSLGGDVTIGGTNDLTLGDIILTANRNLTVSNTGTTTLGEIEGAFAFQKSGAGTLVLDGASTYTGITTISAGSLNLASGASLQTNNDVVLASGATFGITDGTQTLGSFTGEGNVNLGAGTLVVGGGDADGSFTGIIAATAGRLVKEGAGTFTLGGTNLHTAGTQLDAGNLVLLTDAAVGTGTLFINGGTISGSAGRDVSAVSSEFEGTFTVGGTNDFTFGAVALTGATTLTAENTGVTTISGVVSGAFGLTKAGSATTYLGAANTYTGGTTISAGTLVGGNADALGTGTLFLRSGTLVADGAQNFGNAVDISGTSTIGGTGAITLGDVALTGTSTLAVTNSGTTTVGALSGSDGFTKSGSGLLVLTGASTHSGTTTLAAGTLQLDAGASLTSGANMVLASGATFDLNDNNQTFGGLTGNSGTVDLGSGSATFGSGTFAGDIIGTGNVIKTGASTLVLTGANAYSGATTVGAGVLEIANNNALGTSTVNIDSGAALHLNAGGLTVTNNITVNGSGAGGTGAVAVTSGSHTLSGTTTLAGATTVNIAAATAATFSGIIDGGFALSKDGTGTLILTNGSNTFDSLDLNAGVVELAAANALTSGSSADLAASTTLNLNDTNQSLTALTGTGTLDFGATAGTELALVTTGTNTFAGNLTGSGSVVKSGAGTLVLEGTNNQVDGITINAGAVSVASDAALGATATGITTLNEGSLIVTGSGFALNRNINVSSAGTLNLTSGGTVTLGGLTGSGTLLTLEGGTVVNNGTDVFSDDVALSIASTATFDLNDTTETVGNLAGAGTVDLGSGTLSIGANDGSTTFTGNIAGTGNLVKEGTGVFNYSATNASTGLTIVEGGTFNNIGGTIAGNMQVNGAILSGTNTYTSDIELTGAGTLTTSGSATTLTVTGDVSGTGLLTVSGTGKTVALTGAVSNTGGIVIGSTNTLDSAGFDNLPGGGTIANSGTLAVTQAASSTFTGTISGSGVVLIDGTGTVNFTAAQTYTGATTLSQATLLVNNTIASSAINVDATGRLGGAGTIAGNLVNAGTIAPGNSPGTLTISGNFTNASTATVIIEIASETSFDIIDVTGSATLAGTLQIVLLDGYEPINEEEFVVIDADGGLSGTFATITQPTDIEFTLEYGANQLKLIAPQAQFSARAASDPVAAAIGTSLDNLRDLNNADADLVIAALDAVETDAQLIYILKNFISPRNLALMTNINLSHTGFQMSAIGQRLGIVRNSVGAGLQPASSGIVMKNPDGSYFDLSKVDTLAATNDLGVVQGYDVNSGRVYGKKWRLHAGGSVSFGDYDARGNALGYDFTTTGITVGADRAVGEYVSVGLMLGYGNSDSDIDADLGEVNVQSLSAGMYAGWARDGIYVNVLAGAGISDYETKREIEVGSIDRTAQADPSSIEAFASMDAGVEFKSGQWTFGPISKLEVTRSWLDGYTETGAGSLNLRTRDQKVTSVQGSIGGQVGYTLLAENGQVLRPYLSALYRHEFANNSREVRSTFATGGNAFSVNTDAPQRSTAILGAGFSLDMTDGVSVDLGLQSINDIGGKFNVLSVNGGLNWAF